MQGRRATGRWGIEEILVFGLGFAGPLFLAFNGGGLDSVFRQEFSLGLWWAAALAVPFGLLARGRPLSLRPALAALAALLALTALSLLWTESKERSFDELDRLLGLAGIVFVAAFGLNRGNWRAGAAGICAALLALPAVAVLSRLAPQAFDTGFVVDPSRLSYPLEYWNAVACWAAMAVAVGLGLASQLRDRALRALSLSLVPVAGTAVYLTYSRGGLVATAVGVAAVLLIAPRRPGAIVHTTVALGATATVVLVIRSQPAIADGTGGDGGAIVGLSLITACAVCGAVARSTANAARRTRRASLSPSGAAAAGAVAIGAAALVLVVGAATSEAPGDQRPGPLPASSYSSLTSDPASRLLSLGGSRGEIWSSALRAFGSDPLKGTGPGTFELWHGRDVPGGEAVRDAHSIVLGTLAGLGLPGLILLALFLGGLLICAVKSLPVAEGSTAAGLRVALVAAFLVFVFQAGIDWMWEVPAVAAVALLAITTVAASTVPARRAGRQLSARRLALVAFAVLAGVMQIPAAVSTERVRAATFDLVISRNADALRAADAAVTAEPWAASPYAARAFVQLARSRLGAAQDDAQRAADHEPTNFAYRILLARVARAEGDEDAMREYLRQARELRP